MDLHTLEVNAIDSALKNDWNKAIEFNQKILQIDPNNIDALLRLGFSFLQRGDFKEAKKAYKRVLEIQPNHPIAKEKTKQINVLLEKKDTSKKTNFLKLDPNLFADVPGKTKTTTLVNLGQKQILAKLNIGEKIELKIRKRKVEARTLDGEYIGALPDDISKRLILFINAGSKYEAYIKEASLKKVTIFIKEVSKGRKVAKFISFPDDMRKNLAYLEKILEGKDEEEQEEEVEETEEETDEEPEDIEQLAEELEKYQELEELGLSPERFSKDDEEDDE